VGKEVISNQAIEGFEIFWVCLQGFFVVLSSAYVVFLGFIGFCEKKVLESFQVGFVLRYVQKTDLRVIEARDILVLFVFSALKQLNAVFDLIRFEVRMGKKDFEFLVLLAHCVFLDQVDTSLEFTVKEVAIG